MGSNRQTNKNCCVVCAAARLMLENQSSAVKLFFIMSELEAFETDVTHLTHTLLTFRTLWKIEDTS